MTLAELRARCRAMLPSSTEWSDADLNGWVQDGIRHYSQYFPRRRETTQALTTGTQVYALPSGFLAMLLVEYPTGQSPARHLAQVSEVSDYFKASRAAYALRLTGDATDPGDIVFAEVVSTGESALLTYQAMHDIPAADADVITVPDHHIEAVVSYVEFAAYFRQESAETADPDPTTVQLSMLGTNAGRAWRRYLQVLRDLRRGEDSGWVKWGGEYIY